MFTPWSGSEGRMISSENSRSRLPEGDVKTSRNLYLPGRDPVFRITTTWHETIEGAIWLWGVAVGTRTTSRSISRTIVIAPSCPCVTRSHSRAACRLWPNDRQPKVHLLD